VKYNLDILKKIEVHEEKFMGGGRNTLSYLIA